MNKRSDEIFHIIKANGKVSVAMLAQHFRKTEKTIRLDLQLLEDAGLISRTYGGATLAAENSPIYPSQENSSSCIKQKTEIAREALAFIHENMTVVLDSGTTSRALASLVPDCALNIITNDFLTAEILLEKKNISVYFIGGCIRNSEISTISYNHTHIEKKVIESLKADLYFVDTNSINHNGYMVFNDCDIEIKKSYLKIADRAICLADSKKFDRPSFYRFASLKRIRDVITDSQINPAILTRYRRYGLNIITAKTLTG